MAKVGAVIVDGFNRLLAFVARNIKNLIFFAAVALVLGGMPVNGGAKVKFYNIILGAMTYKILIAGLVMLGIEPKTKELSSQINSARLSFADADDMLKFLDIEPGAVSIMGLMNDKEKRVRLLIDSDVLRCDGFACHPCRNTHRRHFFTLGKCAGRQHWPWLRC